MPRTSIVTLTMNPAIDVSVEVDHVTPERKLRCSTPRREPGGGGLNVARAIRRMDGASTAVYPAGGPPGEALRLLLDAEGLDHRPIGVEAWTRDNLIALESATGRQYRFCLPGAPLEPSEWRACLEAAIEVDDPVGWVVASGSLPPGVPDDFYARLGAAVARVGARFVLDTSGASLREGIASGAHLLKPNLRELADLAGRALESEAEQEAAARAMVDDGLAEIVVVSMGAAGALWVTAEGGGRIRSPTVPIVSRVGAGDSMVAAMVLALARGLEPRAAAVRGVAAGAAAVTTPGTELCRGEDVERLARAIDDEAATAWNAASSPASPTSGVRTA